jgi:4-hydroxy-tetrahydrodipicolinate reductase
MSNDTSQLAIIGAAGRMGGELVDALAESDSLKLAAPVVRDVESAPDQTIGGVEAIDDISTAADRADAMIEFSSPQAAVEAARQAADAGIPLVSGTTGLDDTQQTALEDAADQIPMVRASNFSVGINVLLRLVDLASTATDGDDAFDIEVSEAHHRHKVDAPSGTALSLARAAAEARGWALEDVSRHARQGEVGERPDDEIGFQVTRGGSIVGDHNVQLCGPGERIELTHRSGDRGVFARGALRAARWLLDNQTDGSVGIHDMQAVLFTDE